MSQESSRNLECEEIFARLSEYLDQELPADVADCISEHISDCEPCIDFLESLRKSVALCKQFHADEMPSPLADDIREQLRKSYERTIKLRRGANNQC
jgi:predicted anti-sigma-YlaC factor YlaD